MADFAGTMKEAAFATSPREFDLSYSTTLEEIFDKLNARRTAFQMPFQIKGGVAGQRIVFEKEPNLDVTLWLYLSNGTHIRIQPVISEARRSVGGVRVDKNSALRKGVKGATIGLATDRGGYIDAVTDAVQKILNGEPVADYIPPAVPGRRGAAEELAYHAAPLHLLRRARHPPLLCRQDRHRHTVPAYRRGFRYRSDSSILSRSPQESSQTNTEMSL